MRPRKTKTTGSGDPFRGRLDQIINMGHELVRLAEAIDGERAWNIFQKAGRQSMIITPS